MSVARRLLQQAVLGFEPRPDPRPALPWQPARCGFGRIAHVLLAPQGQARRSATRAPVLQIIAAAAHQRNECRVILRQHGGAQPLDRLGERLQGLRTVVVQALYFIIQIRALLGDAAGDIQLRIEGGAGQARQFRRGLAALGERGEEGDVERVRETEHVGDQAVVIIEAHHHLLGHGRREQLAHARSAAGVAQVHEDHVAPGEQLRVRTEHRVHGGHLAAVGLQRQQSGAQRRLQRPDVENHPRRAAQRQIA